ncbi:gamma-glutamyl-gamma-aminobutyrate hydrolase family protein [Legionella septentrionalis]|uniref:Glutamine amidotransferase n=1 Tax=Legionella septentrionalis TaxID=2498109 RepID=A0A3S0VBQ8_9GAMM|nr:gamma-glutamyl-gamma-aminobutyrate hydrolase family protein [Legionella septentrionalis]RUQ91058.1 glutamine amidotransferase [Legionella septentrionalis]RUR02873.1 glutamine amidotransferase [Legionella septentrionalis]RUR11471.1 glutamine amidotransferase [Legionella septentrionalis]RUR16736.1 glutamine amidotransferase [Legionella septentrionalis]
MKKIGITQRVDLIDHYQERRDCLDQRWFSLLESSNLLPVPVPGCLTDVKNWIECIGIDGFILSGGNDLAYLEDAKQIAPERDRTEHNILTIAENKKLPVLGVCRGFQIMNVYLSGNLTPVAEHVGSKHTVNAVTDHPLFSFYTRVNSYHAWGINHESLASKMLPALQSHDGTIEAAYHKNLPWVGIMWHPEREHPFNEHDKTLISTLFRS